MKAASSDQTPSPRSVVTSGSADSAGGADPVHSTKWSLLQRIWRSGRRLTGGLSPWIAAVPADGKLADLASPVHEGGERSKNDPAIQRSE
jgi:hypothetical protein